MINTEVYKKCLEFKNKNGRWPRSTIKINGKRLFKKDVKNNPEYEDLEAEFDLSYEWKKSPERKILMNYKGVKIEDIPEEYQDMIQTLRSFGLGVDGKTVDIAEEFVNFYKTYGRVPRKIKDGKTLTKEEQTEKRLYQYWCACKENKLLEQYVSMELDQIPEEHRDMVEKLRSVGLGLKSKKTTNLVDYIAFVKDKKREPVYIMHPKNEDELYERDLKQRWRMCKEHSIYKKYKGILLKEIPEEDRALVEKIRNLWLEVDGNSIAEDMANFIKKYNREPRDIHTNLQYFNGVLTEEEQNEGALNARWERSFEKQVLDRFVGVPNDEIPDGYKEIVNKFREIGLGSPESINTRRYISFILEHKRRPRQVIYRYGIRINAENCTTEEADEQYIRHRWDRSKDRQIYEKYKNSELDDETTALYSDMIKDLQKAHKIKSIGTKVKIKQRKKKALKKNHTRSIEDDTKIAEEREKEKAERARIAEERKKEKAEKARIAEERRKAKEKRKRIAEERKKAKEEKERLRAEKRRAMEEADRAKAEEKRRIEEAERAEAEEKRKLEEEQKREQKRKKEEPKKKIIEQKLLEKIEIAKKYIAFIQEFHREPLAAIRVGGKDVEIENLMTEEVEEIKLGKAWKKSKFIEIIDEYAGTPIDELPEICRDVIADFRKLGFGLTYEEYVKFRENNTTDSVLRSVKSIRNRALKKKSRALALEKEVLEQLKLRGKEQDDEPVCK